MALRQQSLDFTVYAACDSCGGNLEISLDRDTINVTPCEKCMEEAREEGIKEGKASS